MAFDGLTMTTQGINLQTKVQAGTTLSFTKIKVGDGVLSSGTTLAALTDLIDAKLTVNIESVKSLGDGSYRVRGTLTNASVTTGFFLREVGVYATDPDDGEILYSVANAGDECDYLPAGGGAVVVEQVIDLVTAVGSASSVTATIDEGAVLLSKATFTEHQEATPIDHPDSSVTTAKIADSAVTDAKIGTREIDDTVVAASGAGLLTNLLAKIGNMIKKTTGKDAWYTAPDVSLAEVLPLAGGDMTGPINESQGTDIASSATTDIGMAAGNFVQVTGTTTITSLGTVQAGAQRIVRFTGALTLTHNASSLILPGAADITTAAGDVAEFISLGSGNWVCVAYQRASGLYLPLAGGTMFGAIAMGSHKITGLASGTASGDAVHYGQFAALLDTNGYTKLPNGLILQWGYAGNFVTTTVTFPMAFPTACCSITYSTSSGNGPVPYTKALTTTNVTIGNVVPTSSTDSATVYGVRWIAIGY